MTPDPSAGRVCNANTRRCSLPRLLRRETPDPSAGRGISRRAAAAAADGLYRGPRPARQKLDHGGAVPGRVARRWEEGGGEGEWEGAGARPGVDNGPGSRCGAAARSVHRPRLRLRLRSGPCSGRRRPSGPAGPPGRHPPLSFRHYHPRAKNYRGCQEPPPPSPASQPRDHPARRPRRCQEPPAPGCRAGDARACGHGHT